MQDLGVRGFESVKRPQQSYQVAALDEAQVDKRHALLSIQRLPYVIRLASTSVLRFIASHALSRYSDLQCDLRIEDTKALRTDKCTVF